MAKNMDYLKDKQHYIDRYDLSTIKKCHEVIGVYTKAYAESLEKEKDIKDFSKAEMAKASNWLAGQVLFQIKAERYRDKEETIQKWMDEDKVEQEKYDNTPEPRNIRCIDCKHILHSTLKHLNVLDNPLTMMFIFECTLCKKKKWINEDGTERKIEPLLCPKCKAEAEMSTVKESEDQIIWKLTCSKCGFTKTTTDDFKEKRAERKKQEEDNKKLLEQNRKQFCSDEEGKEALEYVEALKVAKVVYDEELKKYDSFAYQKVSQLKKLSTLDLEKMLNPLFEKEQYLKLSFGNPEIGQHVIVYFTVQDADFLRKEDASIDTLQKILKDTLEGTNWRLMSDGISYRLGYLSGRLKGYEREEDFFEFSGEKKEEESSKIDYETRMKYGGHNVVQMARLNGEFQGIKNTRERRLKKEPEGFFLEEDGYYTCQICGENYHGNKIWWNLEGIRCADCWRNIKEGVIPPLIWDNDSIWIKDWQISSDSDFDIHPSTARKLRRKGILNGRDLKREDGTIYCTIYLVEENKEFLKKYPRKPKQKFIVTDLLGEKLEL